MSKANYEHSLLFLSLITHTHTDKYFKSQKMTSRRDEGKESYDNIEKLVRSLQAS